MIINQVLHGDCMDLLDQIYLGEVDTCVTSPPYFGLRDYQVKPTVWPSMSYRFFGRTIDVPAMTCCLGLEKTPEQYVGHMVAVMRKVRDVLAVDGTLWLNLGDSYARSGGEQGGGNRKLMHMEGKQKRMTKVPSGLKEKDLIGIPWMVAFALREDGWYLRSDIIWHKPNPMPESVTDRPTKSHEHIFLFSKSKKYYYDAKSIMAPSNGANGSSFDKGKTGEVMDTYWDGVRKSGNKARKSGSERMCPEDSGSNVASHVPWEGNMANKRDVWTVATTPFGGAHYATFPEQLIKDCVKAGCPPGGLVLDPFCGRGTTGLVAKSHGRNYLCFDVSEENVAMAREFIGSKIGMFANV